MVRLHLSQVYWSPDTCSSGLACGIQPQWAHVATVSGDKIVRVFNVYPTTQALMDHARSIGLRDLTPRERKRFFIPVEGEVGGCPN